jgi:hypothetical protein
MRIERRAAHDSRRLNAALAPVLADVASDPRLTTLAVHVFRPRDERGLWIGFGTAMNWTARPLDLDATDGELMSEITGDIQVAVIEELWAPWPLCSEHQVGCHFDGDPPAWWCRGGDSHLVGAVGELIG